MIERAREVTDELSAALARLLPQLSSAPLPSADELVALVANPDTHLLVARRAAGAIAGISTLTLYR
ncbi:MAG: GNAT family N-acetyltransferase, partial [Deltaproteobacteria bacterium]|nr:GNAT family N-acetyltransferase [Deltaproteobacteria bacterium]